MAFEYFMNMEKLSLTIVNNYLLYMTDNNYEDDVFLKMDELTNNIENGFVIITQLSCFFESFLNTIINACIDYNGELLLKCSVEEKIELIFMHYKKDWAVIKGQNSWSIYKKTRVRNEMIHFKKTYIGDGSGIPNFKLGGQWVADFFTKKNMTEMSNGYLRLTELIAASLGLFIFKDIDIFEDGLVNYVYDEKTINIDESRYK